MGKVCALGWPFQSDQKQSTPLPLMFSTVINGPPERSRTRSPRRNGGTVQRCNVGVDGAGSKSRNRRQAKRDPESNCGQRGFRERAHVKLDVGAEIGTHFAETTKLYFRSGMPKGRTIGTSEPCAVGDALRRSVMVLDSARRPIAAGFGQHRADAMPGQP